MLPGWFPGFWPVQWGPLCPLCGLQAYTPLMAADRGQLALSSQGLEVFSLPKQGPTPMPVMSFTLELTLQCL